MRYVHQNVRNVNKHNFHNINFGVFVKEFDIVRIRVYDIWSYIFCISIKSKTINEKDFAC